MKRVVPWPLILAGVLLIGLWVMVMLPHSLLREGDEDELRIVFSEARLIPEGERLLLDAEADIALPAAVRSGLDNGVPLEFVVELTLAKARSPWPDKRLLTERWRYRLIYYELTRHYRINAMDGGESRNYRSLSRALEGLGSVRAELDTPQQEGRIATVHMYLDSERLPLPLRPVLGGLWRSSWTISGDNYRWTYDMPDSDVS